jgi:hypothetical protein
LNESSELELSTLISFEGVVLNKKIVQQFRESKRKGILKEIDEFENSILSMKMLFAILHSAILESKQMRLNLQCFSDKITGNRTPNVAGVMIQI